MGSRSLARWTRGLLAVCIGGCAPAGAPTAVAPAAATAPSAACAGGAPSHLAVPASPPPPAVAAILHEVDGARMKADVVRLAAFGTRHTLSDTASDTRGIGAARRWIEAEMRRAGGGALQVSTESHVVHPDGKRIPRDVDVADVVATLPGASPRRVYVVGHYDSRCSDVMDASCDAPGANDDASGVAVLLELARVLSRQRFDATVVLLATAGEEQGLLGAREHARTLAGVEVSGVFNNDIVGDPAGGDPRVVRVFSKGDDAAPSRQLAQFVADTAAWEKLDVTPLLVLRADRVHRGGDHLAFDEAGFPAVRFTASAEEYSRQHQNVRTAGGVAYGDTPDHVDPGYLAAVARLNAAAVAHLADAPEPPRDARISDELSADTLVRWSPARDADVAGYEVVWRSTTSPRWEHARDVGRTTEARVPVSKDDFFFGVRAYDATGYRSPVASAPPAAQ